MRGKRRSRSRAPSSWYADPTPTTPPTTESRTPSRASSFSHFQRFATLSDCVEYAKSTGARGHDSHFAGGTQEDAYRFAVSGWQDGVRRASTIATRIADRVLQTRASDGYDLVPDVSGAAYDVGAYLSGVPECWIIPTPNQPRRAVAIAYNVAASCGVSADTLMTRGLAVLALALALNAKGYPITVDVCQTCYTHGAGSGGDECFVTRVADASSGSPLDVDRLAFALGHPTMFRQVYAAVTGSHWGSCAPRSDTYPHDTEYDIRIGGAHLDEVERWRDGGEAWVLSEYERQTAG